MKPMNTEEIKEKHIWDSPWTSDQIREHCNDWSLGADSGLLNRLQDIAQNLVSQTHLIQKEINSLSYETEVTNATLNNVNNEFLMLSNCQFIESRVYDEDVSSNDNTQDSNKKDVSIEKNKDEKDIEIISKVSCALKLGISVIDKAYEHLQVQDSDSEEEKGSYQHESILHPKDPYANRPLPYIIGSELFYCNNTLGISGNLSDDELPDDVSIASSKLSDDLPDKKHYKNNGVVEDVASDVESEHDSRLIASADEHTDNGIFSPEVDNDDKSSVHDEDDIFSSTLKTNFNKELASKLQIPQPVASESSSKLSKDSSGRRGSKDVPDDLQTEWPSVKQSKSSDLLSSQSFGSSEDDDDLFGKGGLFSSKKKAFDDASPETLITSKNTESKEKKENQNLFKPKVTEDLFSNSDDDTDLFFTSTAKKSAPSKPLNEERRASNSDQNLIDKKLPIGAQSMFGSNANKLNQQFSQRIKNNDLENEGSEYGGSQVSRSTSSASIRDSKKDAVGSAISASSSGNLFANDDDDVYLFGSSTISTKNPQSRPTNSLFDDFPDDDLDDIFAPTTVKSSFGSKPPSVSSNQQDKLSITKSELSSNNDEDNDDDLFFQASTSKQSSLFDFATESKPSPVVNSTQPISKLSTKTEPVKKPLSKKLFDDDDADDFDDDLFKGSSLKAPKPATKEPPSQSKEAKKNFLFDEDEDDDLLFGSSKSDSPGVNLFESTRKEVKMKGEKKEVSVKNVDITSPHEVASEEKLSPLVTDTGAVKSEEKREPESSVVVSTETDKKLSTPTPAGRKPVITGDKVSKLRNELGDKLINIGSLVSPEATRKKPIGGVSILNPGGIPSLKPQRSPSPIEKSNTEVIDEKSEKRTPIGSPIITPFGAASTKEEAVSFDDPIEANPLHNANKERAKIQVKRRPQTRKARHETIRNSAIVIEGDKLDSFLVSEPQASSISAPTSPVSSDSTTKHTLPITSSNSNKLKVEPTPLSPSTDEDDLFVTDSRQPAIPPLIKGSGVTKSSFSATKQKSSSDNLFGESSDEGDADELFKAKPSKSKSVTTKAGSNIQPNSETKTPSKIFKKSNDDDDWDSGLFGEAPKSSVPNDKTPAASENKSQKIADIKKKSLVFDDDDDDDLFKSSSSIVKKTVPSQNSQKATSAKQNKSLFGDDSDDNLFDDPLTTKKK